jgi:hypothetical protein
MEALNSSETSLNFYYTIQRHIPEDNSLADIPVFGKETLKKTSGPKRKEISGHNL